MNIHDELKWCASTDKSILIYGLGITGVKSALFFQSLGLNVICADLKPFAQFENNPEISIIRNNGGTFFFGVTANDLMPRLPYIGFCVLSPGISPRSEIPLLLNSKGVSLRAEIEIGLELCKTPAVVVTGSNGKSTTATLIDFILRSSGFDSTLCGNIGYPILEILEPEIVKEDRLPNKDFFVVEASSYQLELCTKIRPKVGIFLNLTDNHLERHDGFENYFKAKTRLFQNQTYDDFAVLNLDDSRGNELSKMLKSNVLGFGQTVTGNGARISYSPGENVDKISVTFESESFDIPGTSLRLFGLHNRYNVAAATLASIVLGVPKAKILNSLCNFSSIEHRLEIGIRMDSGGTIINDSKSTTVASSKAAVQSCLEKFRGYKLLLLLGGKAKAGSWDPLTDVIQKNSNLIEILFFGEDGQLLKETFHQANLSGTYFKTLKDAVYASCGCLKKDTVLLFSPGCASFDEFNNFEERGYFFKSTINKILGSPIFS